MITPAQLEDRMRRVEALHRTLMALLRNLTLCFTVVYLSGLVLGVVIAKAWWGIQ